MQTETLIEAIQDAGIRLTKQGGMLKGRCPFHPDGEPSLVIYGVSFHCFGCDKTGDILEFKQLLNKKFFDYTLTFLRDEITRRKGEITASDWAEIIYILEPTILEDARLRARMQRRNRQRMRTGNHGKQEIKDFFG